MRHIGFKNFRKFINFPDMEFGDITILVGSNNSGKSTVEKAMMLVSDNLRNLRVPNLVSSDSMFAALDNNNSFRFDLNNIHDVHVDTFGRALNNQTKDPEIVFSFGLSDFSVTLKLTDKNLNSPEAVISEAVIYDGKQNVSYDINYAKSVITFEYEQVSTNTNANLEKTNEHIKYLLEQLKEVKSPLEGAKLNEELAQYQSLQKKLVAVVGTDDDPKNKVQVSLGNRFADTVDENELVNRIRGLVNYAYIEAEGDKRSAVYKKELSDKNTLKANEQVIKDSARRLNAAIYSFSIEYIQAHAAFQKAVFSTEDKNDYTAKTIYEFITSKINSDSEEYKFVTTWMQRFNIGYDFNISSLQGTAFSVRLFDSNEEKQDYLNGGDHKGIELADKGMGSNQLMLLLWRMATLLRKYKYTESKPLVIIEEPEQNLHPSVQSLLADLFLELNEKYGFRFIIETHSEYLVRHVQVLAARMFKAEKVNIPFKVFYLTGNSKNPYYDMGFQKNGKFVKNFGDGFFNVSDDSEVELYELEED